MRQRRDVFDRFDCQSGRFKGCNGTFAAAARPFYLHIQLLDAEFNRLLRTLLGSTLSGKWRALSTSLEPARTSAGPAERVALGIRDGHGGIVKRRFDMGDANSNVSPGTLFLCGGHF